MGICINIGIAIESSSCLMYDEFSLILILNCSAIETISIAFNDPAAIDGQIEVVNMKPGEKLLI